MEREIKFRAWNKSKQQMFLSPSDIRHLGSWFDAHLPGSLSVPENISIMQFTGKKDMDGKYIYEGDIISSPIRKKPIAVIEYYYCGFVLKWIDQTYINVRQFPKEPIFHNIHFFEVIGNIHQDPELLP